MSLSFFKTAASSVRTACFRELLNYDDDWELLECRSLVDEMPDDIAVRMNAKKGLSSGTQTQAVLHTLFSGGLVVDDQVLSFLKERCADDCEHFPISVLDKKGSALRREYYLVNVLRAVDCIDREATEYKVHSIDEEMYTDVHNLTVDESVIPDRLMIFRIAHLQNHLAVREPYLRRLGQLGVTDFQWAPVKGWSERPGFDGWRWASDL